MMDRIIRCGSIVGALSVIIGGWIAIGGPIPAFSSDIQRLDRKQVDTAVDLYAKDVRDAIILRGTVQDATTRALIDENLRSAQEKLKAAQDRKIELTR